MPAAQESPELQPTFHEITVGIPLGELVKGHASPSVSRLQIGLLQKYTDRYALMDGTDGAVFSSAPPPQAETGQRNVAINGVHPFHTSAESQAHWKNATDIVGVKRTAERVSIEETELVTDTLTPLFENGTPRLLDRIGSALRGIAKPVLVTQTAFGGAAGAVAVVPDNIDAAAHYQMANRPAQVETIVFDQASPSPRPSIAPSFEPSPIPSVEPSLDPNASPEPVDPCVTEPAPAAEIDGGTIAGKALPLEASDESPAPPSGEPVDPDLPGVDTDGDGDVDEDDKTAAVDPCETESPSSSSIKVILDNEFVVINKKEFNRIINQASKETAEWFDETGQIPGDTPEEDAKHYKKTLADYLKDDRGFSVMGSTYASTVVGQVSNAQQAEAAGDLEATDAFMDIASAFQRAGKTWLEFDNGDTELLDIKIQEEAVLINLK